MKRTVPLALLVVALAACGGGGGNDAEEAAEDAQEHLADAESGQFSLSLTGERDGEEVGFGVEGAFQYPEDDAYPILDLTYTRSRGEDSSENEFRSDGTSAWVIDGATITPVGLNQLQGLRQREGVAGAVPDLDIASWFDDATMKGDVISGEVDVAELVGDLQRIAAEIDGNQASDEVAAADALRKAARSSSIELRTEGDDHELRTLRVVVDFGDDIPEAVDTALVAYAASRLVLEITFEPLDGPLEVEQPGTGG